MSKISITLLFFIIVCPLMAQEPKSLKWRIKNTSWSTQNDLDYRQFIHQLGEARKKGACQTTNDCLKSTVANPLYAKLNPSRLISIFSDCADLPFILRAYFSWMNDLPFSYPIDLVEAKKFSRLQKDIRYSKFGNIITARRVVRDNENVNQIFQDIVDSISTASFRTNAGLYDSGSLFRDTYPVEIDRRFLIPGTVLYDANGHVAVVYEVTANGKILLLDAHPDNSLTTLTYGEKFARSSIRLGGGFSNFRPFSVIENKLTPKKNAELSGFSLIQYQKDPFIYNGKQMSFYEYVRNKLADGDIIYEPITEFRDYMNELCQDIKNREEAVNLSLKAGIQNQNHPYELPENIYGTEGVWEAFATPSRDARLKTSVKQGKNFLTKVINGYLNHDLKISYEGQDLISDLREIYINKSQSCNVNAKENLIINLDLVLVNLFALSFDPYHCAELRWGLTGLSSCKDNANKIKWYKAEQGLRNRIEVDYSIKTNYNVNELPRAPVSQVPRPDLSFDKLLEIKR